VEVLYTTALCLVVLHSATAPQTTGTSFYGLAIGSPSPRRLCRRTDLGWGLSTRVGIGRFRLAVLGRDGSLANLWLYLLGRSSAALSQPRCTGCKQLSRRRRRRLWRLAHDLGEAVRARAGGNRIETSHVGAAECHAAHDGWTTAVRERCSSA